ncbi:MAG: hypothetical protein JSW27_24890 [Phycisphaerales bacterium]|nr:MAG: hypothetical protein JSW27_24890 [Phycisphaerales bacterium]
MGIRGRAIAVIVAAFIGLGAVLLTGCAGRAQAVFTKPELLTYERLAVIGLDAENEQIFMAAYIKTFISRPVTFVERSRLAEIIGEQDLLQGRLDDRTRAKIKKILGVEALIMCEYYKDDDRPGSRMKLRVRVVDSETGAIVGSALTDTYSNFAQHAQAAVEALKADLLDEGYRRSYPPSPETTPPSR